MTEEELKELQRLLLKLRESKPDLLVVVTDLTESKLYELVSTETDYCADLIIQIDIDNDSLR